MTGWTVPELRATPGLTVRALFHRIYAGLVWHPEIATLAGRSISRASFGSFSDYLAARDAQAAAGEYQRVVTSELWPEDADG